MEITRVTQLEDAFTGEPSKSSRFEVKILKKYSDEKFLIADDSDHCILRLDPHVKYQHLLKENNKLRIINPKVDFERKELKIEPTTRFVEIRELPNDEYEDESQKEESQEDKDEKVEGQLTTIEDVMNSFESKDKYLKVEVMFQDSRNVFQVGDESGHCYLFTENHEELLEKGKHLYILNFHVSKDNTIVLDQTSYVELTSEYEKSFEEKRFEFVVKHQHKSSGVLLSQEFSGAVSPNPEDVVLANCKVCLKNVKYILKHLSKSPDCEKIYTEAELSELRQEAKVRNKKKEKSWKKSHKENVSAQNAKYYKNNSKVEKKPKIIDKKPVEKPPDDPNAYSIEDALRQGEDWVNEEIDWKREVQCRECKKTFISRSIYAHITRKRECKDKYSEKEKEKLSMRNFVGTKEKEKIWFQENKEKVAEQKKEWYQKNKSEIARKKAIEYEQHKDFYRYQKADYYE